MHSLSEDCGRRVAKTRTISPRAQELFSALAAIRTSPVPPAHAHHHEWALIYRYVKTVCGRTHYDAEDRVQEVMVAILLSIQNLRAMEPLGACAWIRTICRHALIDAARRSRPTLPFWEDRQYDRVENETERTPFEQLEAVIASFEDLVAEYLATKPRQRWTALRKRQAHVALHRLVLGQSTERIIEGLDVPVSRCTLWKWTERGRAVLIETVAWLHEIDEELGELYAVIAETAARRRRDAGLPRPERRRSRSFARPRRLPLAVS